MSGLKIHSIPSDKESWENVAPIVHKSFHVFSTNMSNIKRWTDKTDDKLKHMSEQHQQIESRLNATDDSLRETQVRLQELVAECRSVEAQGKKECDTFSACIKQLLDATTEFFDRFVTAFGADAALKASEQEPELEDGELDNLRHLQVLCSRLGVHSAWIKDAFDVWSSWRLQAQEELTSIKSWVDQLHHSFESTRERLLTWREMLKESSYAVDSLSSSLSETQSDVRRLQSTKMTREDLDEAVGACATELRELNSQTEQRLDGVSHNLETSTAAAEDSIKDLETRFEMLVFQRCNDLASGVERQLNPITAYLNTMHVKADTMRVELDGVHEQLPKLSANIDDVSTQLNVCDGEGKQRSSELSGMLADLTQLANGNREKGEADRMHLTGSIHELRVEFDDRVSELRAGLDSALQALETVKQGELSNVARDLSSLEQKVARWVHATPLPAKMSEARLYSLEAKLAEEMESRLQLEELVKEDRGKGMWMRGSDGGGLPSLEKRGPSAPPSSSQSARRSARYSRGRTSGVSTARPGSFAADDMASSGTPMIAQQV